MKFSIRKNPDDKEQNKNIVEIYFIVSKEQQTLIVWTRFCWKIFFLCCSLLINCIVMVLYGSLSIEQDGGEIRNVLWRLFVSNRQANFCGYDILIILKFHLNLTLKPMRLKTLFFSLIFNIFSHIRSHIVLRLNRISQ